MRIDKQRSRKFKRAEQLKRRNGIIVKIVVGTIIISASVLINTTYMVNNDYVPSTSPSTVDTIPTQSETKENSATTPSADENMTPSVEPTIPTEPTPTEPTTPSTTPEPPKQAPTPAPEQEQKEKMVALSFDDGPAKTLTPELLQILKDNDAKATFFVLGNRVKLYSDIIAEAYKEGNEIGNHSYDHSDFTKLTKEQMLNQIKTTNDAIYQITHEYPTFFRPPYGAINDTVREIANCPLALWSIDSNDWRSISDEQVINNVMSELSDGKIILMHDIHERTINISKTLLPKIKAQGYKIVSIKELYQSNKIELQNGYVYSKVKKN